MNLSRQLREAMFRYGRRKPHMEYNRYLPGAGYAGAPSTHFGGERHPRLPETYDPIRSEYPTSPGYGPPEPWDAIVVEAFEQRPLGLPRRGPFSHRMPSHGMDVVIGEDIHESVEHVRMLREAGEPVPEALLNVCRISAARLAAGMNDNIAHAVPSSELLEVALDFCIDPLRPSGLAAGHEIAQAIDNIKRDERIQRSRDHLDLSERLYVSTVGLDDPPQVQAEVVGLNSTEGPELPDAAGDSSMAHEAAMADPALSMSLDEMADEFAPDPLENTSQLMEAAFDHGLEGVVEQLDARYAEPPPPQHDPFQLMDDMFNQQMQMMDPFNMMGPMG